MRLARTITLITLALFAFATGSHAQDIGAPAGPYPRIKFETLTYDFGQISDRASLDTDLTFKNEGEATLIINSFRAMCGCLETHIDDDDLAIEPGATGVLHVTFNPQGREGDYRKSIVIRSNDPDQSMVKIDILSQIDPVMSMAPRQMMFTNHVIGREMDHLMKIQSFREGFEVVSLTLEDDSIARVELEADETFEDEKLGTGRLFSYRFFAPAFNIVQTVSTPGVLKTRYIDIDGKEYEDTVEFSVSIQVVGPIDHQPKQVIMLRNKPGAYVNRSIRLKSRTGEPFKVTSVEVIVDHPDIQHWATVNTSGKTEPSLNHTLRISAALPTKPDLIDGTVIVKTDIPDYPEFEIPFRAEVIEPKKKP